MGSGRVIIARINGKSLKVSLFARIEITSVVSPVQPGAWKTIF